MPERIFQFATDRAQTTGFQVIPRPATLYRIDGYCTGSNTFLQLFDSRVPPATNDAPLKSLMVFGNNQFSYYFPKEDMVSFTSGMYAAISTDETKFVADGSGTVVSGGMGLEDNFPVQYPTTDGDFVTPVSTFTFWANAAGFKTLYRVAIQKSTISQTRYAMFFSKDGPVNGSLPFLTVPVTTTADFVTLFGDAGIIPQQTVAGTVWKGFIFYLSNTADSLTMSTDTVFIQVAYV